jgi:hypothetical protein
MRCTVLVVLSAALMANVGSRAEELKIEGTYTQVRPCRGDGKDLKSLLVKITAEEITYSGGTCAISNKRQEGNRVVLRAACKGRSGTVLSGDIAIARRDATTLEIVDQDRNYAAVLNRCPAAADTGRATGIAPAASLPR